MDRKKSKQIINYIDAIDIRTQEPKTTGYN